MGDKILAVILAFIFLATIPVVRAGSEIYKHVDSDGRITFSNRPIKDAKRRQPAQSSTNFPATVQNTLPLEVSDHTQKKRDAKRRQLLENELQNELKLLVNARQNLARIIKDSKIIKTNTTKPQNDAQNHAIKLENTIQAMQKRVLSHERNVTALRKELSSF
jgi:Domain of unknown function (DUF4124)